MERLRSQFAYLAILIVSLSVAADEAKGGPAVDLGGEALPRGAVARFGIPRIRTTYDSPTANLRVQIYAHGARALTLGNDHVARLWDLGTGEELLQFEAPIHLGGLVVTPDNKTLLAMIDQRLRAFDMTTGAPMPVPPAMAVERGHIQTHAGDGRSIVISDATSVSVWDWPAGRLRQRIELPLNFKPGKPREFRLTSDGTFLISRIAGIVDVWDEQTGTHRTQLQRIDNESQQGIDFVENGRQLAILGSEGTIRMAISRLSLWDIREGKIVRTFERSGSRLSLDVAADPRGYVLATAEGGIRGEEAFTLIYEVASGQIRRRLADRFDVHGAVAFTPDGNRLVTLGSYSTGLVWDMRLTSAAAGKKRGSEADLERAWETLGQTNAAAAYDALMTFASDSERAIEIVRSRLRAPPALNARALDRLVADLANESFPTRAKATEELEKRGRPFAAELRTRLAKMDSLEAKRRLTAVLDRFEAGALFPDELRAVRSLEFLEHIGTPAARALIAELTKGEPTADLTMRANAAKGRLDGSKK